MPPLSDPALCSAGPALAEAGHAPSSERMRWQQLLRQRLRGRPQPMLVSGEAATPAASLWTGARRWIEAFRAAGLTAGDRLVVALPSGTPFVQVLVAALWEGVTLAPAAPGTDVASLIWTLDARAAVADAEGRHIWTPDGVAGPQGPLPSARKAAESPTEGICLLLRTSGTAGPGRWIALSDANVFAVLDSHTPHLGLSEQACVLAGLPWHHAFGLVLELLPALLAGAEIVRLQDPRDPEALLAAFDAWAPTHFSAVPLTIRRILQAGGRARLHRLSGGVVGGAPIPADVAQGLSGSLLRVGYGQTEAGPGIMLGEPGRFVPGYLGRPVGCAVRTDADAQLYFSGPNAHAGVWTQRHYRPTEVGRWVATGDRVRSASSTQAPGHPTEAMSSPEEARPPSDAPAYVFDGRVSDSFKLSNGRFVHAGRTESALRDLVPGLLDALLCTLDGESLTLALLMKSGTAPPPLSALRTALGPLADRLGSVQVLTPATWVRHSKGTPDRAAIARALAAQE
ncbi:MAG: AMP-binding protein [Bacteroidota bacterium]